MSYYIATTTHENLPVALMKLTNRQKTILTEEMNEQCSHLDTFAVIGVDTHLFANEIIKLDPCDATYKRLNKKVSRICTCKNCHIPLIITRTKMPYCPKCKKMINNDSIRNHEITNQTIETTIAYIIMDENYIRNLKTI